VRNQTSGLVAGYGATWATRSLIGGRWSSQGWPRRLQKPSRAFCAREGSRRASSDHPCMCLITSFATSSLAHRRHHAQSRNDCCGSIVTEMACPRDVRFPTVSDQTADIAACLKRAITGLMHRTNLQGYSITSSARVRSAGDTVRPSAFAVLRLIVSSYLVGACTGRSAGFSPLRMRST
jgi:hypothetical protein